MQILRLIAPAVLLSIFFLIQTADLFPQVNYNQRDDKYRLLGLKRAKEIYEAAKKELDRAKELYSKKFMSEVEFDKIKAAYADAEVNYQQSLLAVLFENQFVTVEDAVKYQTKDGKKRVRLRMANTSAGSEEYRKLLNIDEPYFKTLQPDVISNVYVSLANDRNEIISRPYESKITELLYGKPRDLDFQLLQDLDAVTVNIIFGNGSTRSMRIYLQKDQSKNIAAVQSEQFSQEGELGNSAVYDLTLELFSGESNTFSLEVVNLPDQVNRIFRDPQTRARLSQLRFLENANTRKVSLEVTLPDRPNELIKMDESISFYVMVIPVERMDEFRQRNPRKWTEDEIKTFNAGYAKLELIPRGKGRLIIKAPQLYFQTRKSEQISGYIDLVNEGSGRLDNTEVKIDAPLNWLKEVTPSVTDKIETGAEKRVGFRITPPADVQPGRYEIRIKTTSMSDNQPVTAEDKVVTIEIEGETSFLGTLLVVLLITGVLGGIVWFGIKLSRK